MNGSRGRTLVVASVVVAALGAFACEKSGNAREVVAKGAARDTVPTKPPVVPERCATFPASWTAAITPPRPLARIPRDSTKLPKDTAPARDSTRRDSTLRLAARDSTGRDTAALRRAARDTFPTPPTPLPGSVLPGCRIVAYYGNPLSKRMGILGEIAPDSMLARLDSQSRAYERADTATPVVRALELITPVAQGSPGPKGLWRMRMADTVIERIAKLAESKGYLLFLDVQVGKSTVAAELEPLVPFLKRPYVHLALDPEFSMKGPEPPGKKVGTMDAADVNVAVALLAKLVDENKLPPKVLVVHRFRERMLTRSAQIRRDPRVQVVINMDGFGPPRLKYDSYKAYVREQPVQYFGIKLFYKKKNDDPLLTPAEVLRLLPIPQYIQYQ